jgi:hypothetical protein
MYVSGDVIGFIFIVCILLRELQLTRTPEDDPLRVETFSVDFKSINENICCVDGTAAKDCPGAV